MTRTRIVIVIVIAAVLAIGCGPTPSSDACIHVDGRGGAGADGSAAAPLRTIADALATASEGDTICLAAGEHPSPGTIARSITIRGAAPTGATPASTLLPPTAGCTPVTALDVSDLGGTESIDTAAVVLTEGDADVRLESLAIGGCDVAVVARARSTTIAGALLTRARVGLAADHDASARIEDSRVSVAMPLAADRFSCGVCGGTASTLEVHGTDVDAGGHGWAVAGAVDTLVVAGSTLHDGFAGLLVGSTDRVARSVTIGEGTTVHELRALRYGTVLASASLVHQVAAVTIDGADFASTSPDAVGLQIVGAEEAHIADTRFTGLDRAGLIVAGGTYVIDAGVELASIGSGVGLVVGGTPDRDPGPTTVRIAAPLVSSGTADVRHVLVQGAGAIDLAAGATLSGGAIGVQAIDTGSVGGAGAWTIRDVTGAAISLAGTARATLASIDVSVAPGARGLDVDESASLEIAAGTIAAGAFGVHARAGSSVTLRSLRIDGGTEAAIVLEGTGPAMLERVAIADAALGVSIRDGRSVVARDLDVRGSAGSGIEVVRASLDLEGGTLDGNVGAAVAFEDAGGAVRRMTVSGTGSRADDRADDVRIVALDGMEHVVEIAENAFVVDAGRSCTGGCSVVFAAGAGAHGIVRPNCLTATGVPDTFTLASQDGGMLEEPTPAVWADGLRGRLTGATWIAGAAAIVPPPPGLTLSNVVPIDVPAGL